MLAFGHALKHHNYYKLLCKTIFMLYVKMEVKKKAFLVILGLFCEIKAKKAYMEWGPVSK